MAFSLYRLHLFLLPFLALIYTTESNLSKDYYEKTCPQFSDTMEKIIVEKQMAAPTTAAGILRVFFHDCVVGGCDATILIASNAQGSTERDAEINQSLPGDAFDLVVRLKTALELACPDTVSCADILAVATRNLITMVGGPHYEVLLGRKDGLVSRASDVEGHIATPYMPVDKLIAIFASKNLTVQELVTLSGAHTIGFSHCSEFSKRIFNFNSTSQIDPTLNPNFAQALRKLCANYTKETGMSAFNDVMTPGKFDNMYYINLQNGMGLLASDQALISDARTKPYVDLYAKNQTAFFDAFARAIEKVSLYQVKTGKDGEIRKRCDAFNNAKPTMAS
ncbi:PREDICTED: peroxidase 6-like [Ipomoea nil]|uniref:peroxidase 6-like n=1 Tax=Ipomoea nil TaxID=35883 RepID=UPI000900E239|nr:PREDICTED: peroxidase 6-like [Ipomoea nil]